jgi:hypothetical protein
MPKTTVTITIDQDDVLRRIAQDMLDGRFKPTGKIKKFFREDSKPDGTLLERLMTQILPEAIRAVAPNITRASYDEKHAIEKENQLEAFKKLLSERNFTFLQKRINPLHFVEYLLGFIEALDSDKRSEALRFMLHKPLLRDTYIREYLSSKGVRAEFMLQLFEKATQLFPDVKSRDQLFDDIQKLGYIKSLAQYNRATSDVAQAIPAYLIFLASLEIKTIKDYVWGGFVAGKDSYELQKQLTKRGFGFHVLRILLNDIYGGGAYNHDPVVMEGVMSLSFVKEIALDKKRQIEDFSYLESNLTKTLGIIFKALLRIDEIDRQANGFKAFLKSKLTDKIIKRDIKMFQKMVMEDYILELPDNDAQVLALNLLIEQEVFMSLVKQEVQHFIPDMLPYMLEGHDPVKLLQWFSDDLMTTSKVMHAQIDIFVDYVLNTAYQHIAETRGDEIAAMLLADLGIFVKHVDSDIDNTRSHHVLCVKPQGAFTATYGYALDDTISMSPLKGVLSRCHKK